MTEASHQKMRFEAIAVHLREELNALFASQVALKSTIADCASKVESAVSKILADEVTEVVETAPLDPQCHQPDPKVSPGSLGHEREISFLIDIIMHALLYSHMGRFFFW